MLPQWGAAPRSMHLGGEWAQLPSDRVPVLLRSARSPARLPTEQHQLEPVAIDFIDQSVRGVRIMVGELERSTELRNGLSGVTDEPVLLSASPRAQFHGCARAIEIPLELLGVAERPQLLGLELGHADACEEHRQPALTEGQHALPNTRAIAVRSSRRNHAENTCNVSAQIGLGLERARAYPTSALLTEHS